MTSYKNMMDKLELILDNSDNWYTTLSNASAIINEEMDNINWVGFYLYEDDMLYLGPFQGKPACTRISLKNGVCGCCAREKRAVVVEDVEKFPGHIACDSASRSEVCIPIIIDSCLYGLLDIDSPILNRFSNIDEDNLKKAVKIIENKLK